MILVFESHILSAPPATRIAMPMVVELCIFLWCASICGSTLSRPAPLQGTSPFRWKEKILKNDVVSGDQRHVIKLKQHVTNYAQ